MKSLALVVALTCLGSFARAQTQTPMAVPLGSGQKGTLAVPVPDPAFVGCKPFRVEASTTPVLVASGGGLLVELTVSSGSASGAYSVAFDSSGVFSSGSNNWSLGLNAVAQLPAGYAISPKVYTSGAGNTAAAATNGIYSPAKPKQYYNGLVVASSDAGADVNGCYRPAACVNVGCNPY